MLNNQLLLVCLAIGCGAMLGSISIKKVSLGVAGVLFAGKSWPFIGGIVAGVQTQPAVLGFAVGRCGNERVEAG